MADYYVDSSKADDTGDGLTAGTAKKTLAAAAALVTTAGDVLNGTGTFNEELTLPIAGTAAALCWLKSYGAGWTIDGDSTRNCVDGNGKDFWIVDGLTVQDGKTYGFGFATSDSIRFILNP